MNMFFLFHKMYLADTFYPHNYLSFYTTLLQSCSSSCISDILIAIINQDKLIFFVCGPILGINGNTYPPAPNHYCSFLPSLPPYPQIQSLPAVDS